jgi:hypothetical protein
VEVAVPAARVKSAGHGILSFLVRAKSGYYLDEEINTMFAHETGPTETGQTEVIRNEVVFGVRIPGKRTVSEDRIDTEFTKVPDIPHGSLSDKALRPLRRLISEIRNHGTMVFTTMPISDTETNNTNVKEVQQNMLNFPCSDPKLREINDFIKFKQGDPDSLYIHEYCTKVVRTIATELRVPDAQYLVAESARYVTAPAGQLRTDRPGLGSGVLVVATSEQSAYKLILARMKKGCRAGGV